jgi:hypothetical protein
MLCMMSIDEFRTETDFLVERFGNVHEAFFWNAWQVSPFYFFTHEMCLQHIVGYMNLGLWFEHALHEEY